MRLRCGLSGDFLSEIGREVRFFARAEFAIVVKLWENIIMSVFELKIGGRFGDR